MEFMYLTRKIVCSFRKTWGATTEKLPDLSLSFDFVNKPPSIISPPHEIPKLNKPPEGLNMA